MFVNPLIGRGNGQSNLGCKLHSFDSIERTHFITFISQQKELKGAQTRLRQTENKPTIKLRHGKIVLPEFICILKLLIKHIFFPEDII